MSEVHQTAEPAIKIEHVDVLFGPSKRRKQALKLLDEGADREQILERTGMVLGVADASLEIPQGSISILMGLSGSGKSSLLRCINGLNTITRGTLNVSTNSGTVNVASCKGRALRRLRRSNLAMVFQSFGLLPWATVRQNIGFGLSVRGENKALIDERVQEQLSLVGLEAWADKAIGTLSGGMQQRVGLARAFATDADILLMDEPFSGLDPLIREHLQDELLTLQARLKKTIVFVSHDLDEALKLGSLVSIMDGGRIVQTGTVDDIVFNPGNDYVRRFVANINPLSVLSARTIMRSISLATVSDNLGEIRVDEAGVDRILLKQGVPVAAKLRGNSYEVTVVNSEFQLSELNNTVACVQAQTPVKLLLALLDSTSMPILVIDNTGMLCGVIDAQDVCRALASR